ncbi:MAG: hypothetical protein ACO1OX_02305 [Novosphingobium sp.]
MAGLPLLSAELPPELCDDPPGNRVGPRPAGALDGPVHSPVHALQHEILAGWNGVDSADSRQDKAPGWVRLAVPVGSSIALWIVIIGFVRTLL